MGHKANSRKRPVEELPPASSSEDEVEEEAAQQLSSEEDDAVHNGGGSDAEQNSDRSYPSPNVSDFTVMPIVSNQISEPKKSAQQGTSLKKSKKVVYEKAAPALFQRLWTEEDVLAILKGMIEYKATKGIDPYTDMGGFHDLVKKSVRDDVTQIQLRDKIRRLKKKYETSIRKGIFSFPKPHDQKIFDLSNKIWGAGSETKEKKKSKKKAKITSQDNDVSEEGGNAEKMAQEEIEVMVEEDKQEEHAVVANNYPYLKKNMVEEDKREENAVVCNNYPYLKESLKRNMIEEDKREENAVVCDNYPYLNESLEKDTLLEMPCFLKDILRDNLGQMPKEKVKELERMWRELKQDELILYQRRIELVKVQAQVALDFIKNSGS